MPLKIKADVTEPDNVRYCPRCRCMTWHCGEMCEWIEAHVGEGGPLTLGEYRERS